MERGRLEQYSYFDAKTGLRVTAEVSRYPEMPGVVDWVLRFRNEGKADTPILENILPLDWTLAVKPGAADAAGPGSSSPGANGLVSNGLVSNDLGAAGVVVHHARGSTSAAEDFAPKEERFGPGGADHLESLQGDSSSGASLPFFNLETSGAGLDGGVIGAIGWTGNWKADFTVAADGRSVRMAAGMKATHLLLHPGEEIRTPRIVLMRWTGADWTVAQNAWRRVLLAHYTPRQGQDVGNGGQGVGSRGQGAGSSRQGAGTRGQGTGSRGQQEPENVAGSTLLVSGADRAKGANEANGPMLGPVLFSTWGSEPIDNKIKHVQWVRAHGIPIDVFAMDAGWYGGSGGPGNSPWWLNRGDWFPSPLYFPDGVKPLGEAARAAGIGLSVWVEPETAMPGTKIVREHPGWFLKSDRPVNPGVMLANLGDPAARSGLTEMLSGFIDDFGMTWYRQDFNIPPERYWELADTPDRVGMTEIRHIEGLYAMWDELLRRHPGLRIDNCAAGGRRLDVEMLRRSFATWRTDYRIDDVAAVEAQTQGLAPWVPAVSAVESYGQDRPWNRPGPYATPEHLYLERSAYEAGLDFPPGLQGVENAAWIAFVKQVLGEYREAQPYFYGDFYALAPYSLGATDWAAWQWDRPERGDGMVEVLRRPKSSVTSLRLQLKAVDLQARYSVEMRRGLERGVPEAMTGEALARLRVELPEAPGSVLVFYRRL